MGVRIRKTTPANARSPAMARCWLVQACGKKKKGKRMSAFIHVEIFQSEGERLFLCVGLRRLCSVKRRGWMLSGISTYGCQPYQIQPAHGELNTLALSANLSFSHTCKKPTYLHYMHVNVLGCFGFVFCFSTWHVHKRQFTASNSHLKYSHRQQWQSHHLNVHTGLCRSVLKKMSIHSFKNRLLDSSLDDRLHFIKISERNH